jgi:glycine cleavage system aminomethyltransferase T
VAFPSHQNQPFFHWHLNVPDTRVFVSSNDVDKLNTKGKALYSCMLNKAGGVVDDLIVYYRDDTDYRMVINAGTTEKETSNIPASCRT